jgi:hypothetical protein
MGFPRQSVCGLQKWCVWVTETGCVGYRDGLCGFLTRAVCFTETECVGLLKKDEWATVAKCVLPKRGEYCVVIPVGKRNGVCGLQN